MNSSWRSEQEDPTVVSARHVFRGIEYVVTLMIDNIKEMFVLEVEDRLTSDQWRGQFDAKCKCIPDRKQMKIRMCLLN